MTPANGYNPLRWDCAKRGCFNLKRRPKIELFADCFPGRMSFGDVDGIVEVNGNALLLEWKSEERDLPAGQRILYERLTRNSPISVLIVVGDAETMAVEASAIFFEGTRYPPEGFAPADLAIIRHHMTTWSAYAASHPALNPRHPATGAAA
jgi:hypothetical protein